MIGKTKYNLIVICSLFIIGLFILNIASNSVNAQSSLYNVKVVFDVDWDTKETEKPIVPVDEVMELNLTVEMRIERGDYLGEGILIGYKDSSAGKSALIDLEVQDTPEWCNAVLERNRIGLDLQEVIQNGYGNQNVKLFINVDQDAPSYSDGYVTFNLSINKMGLIIGNKDNFTLTFTAGYAPRIKTNLPDLNSKMVAPNEELIFPIEIENIGNARTRVLFEIDELPEKWKSSITDEIILSEEKGSKGTAYLTIISPNDFGYHFEDTDITVTITPVRAESENDVGLPLQANFIVRNRGFSINGIEQFIFYGLIIFGILIVIYLFVFKRKK